MSKTEKLRGLFPLTCDMVIKHSGFGARLPGFKSRLFYLLAV